MIDKIKGFFPRSRKNPRDSSALGPGLNLAFGDRQLLSEDRGGGTMDEVLTVYLFTEGNGPSGDAAAVGEMLHHRQGRREDLGGRRPSPSPIDRRSPDREKTR